MTPYVWRWRLDRIKDRNGNCIYFTYSENPTANDIGAVYPSRIEYNTEKKRRVEFILEDTDRPDMSVVVDQGAVIREARRLAEIRVFVDSQLVKRLVLQYVLNTSTDTSLLAALTKYGSDGVTSLPSERFQYTAFDDGTKTDLLTRVTGTLGNTTTINYLPSSSAANTALPENYWLLGSIEQANGMTGPHALTAFSALAYGDGFYDQASREFRGSGTLGLLLDAKRSWLIMTTHSCNKGGRFQPSPWRTSIIPPR